MDEEGERLDAVDRYDRDPVAETALELGVAGDVDELDVVAAHLPHHLERTLAEVAAGGVVNGDARLNVKSPR